MDVINLGATDGLPPVNWASVVEKLDVASQPAPDAHNARTTWLLTTNEDGSPPCHPALERHFLGGAQSNYGVRIGQGACFAQCLR